MAVHTQINQEELEIFLKNYQIGQLINYQGIMAGIDNSNFIINSTDNKFILTIFESRINYNDLPFYIELASHLSKKNICCPTPIKNNKNQFLTNIKNNKLASLVTFLNGKSLQPSINGLYNNITPDHCYQIGLITAKMHLNVSDFNLKRENDLGVANFTDFFAKFSSLVNDYQPNLKNKITSILQLLTNSWQYNLPSGVIHSDLFPDNAFFDNNNKISGIIDFYFAANDLFIYDFACIVNGWCFDQNNKFSQNNFNSLLNGYQQIRKFTKKELDFLNIALIASATRFLLTRLHDYFFTDKNSLVTIKDPQEYLTKIDYFLNNAN